MTCTCDACGKELLRAVYCDNKCKMSARRDTNRVQKDTRSVPKDTNRVGIGAKETPIVSKHVTPASHYTIEDEHPTCPLCGKAGVEVDREDGNRHFCAKCNKPFK